MQLAATAIPEITRPLPVFPNFLTRFVGRTREAAEVERLIGSARLVTLTGTAGSGKTRLAHHVAINLAAAFQDGCCWVELARLRDPALVPQAIAAALQIAEKANNSPTQSIIDAVQDKALLIILDNCEHLLADVAAFADDVLRSTTQLRLLATSREPLAIAGEQRYPLPPMSLPAPETPFEQLGGADAIRLFAERARAVLPQFELTPENAAAVIDICAQLDGLPLAIELASARLNVLTLEQIATRLHDRYALLVAAPHLTNSPHRTLYAAVEWSYKLLSPLEQAMLRRLSIFVAGCSLETFEAICTVDLPEVVQPVAILSSLVDKSLINADTLRGREARYTLLELIRQFAREKLVAADEARAIYGRLLAYFVERTRPIWSAPPETPIDLAHLAWLETEYDNLRMTLSWALEQHQLEAGLKLANALYPLWHMRNWVHEGRLWVERLLAQPIDALPLALRVNALTNAAYLAMLLGDASAAFAWGNAAVALCEAAGEAGRPLQAHALSGLAAATRAAGDIEALFDINARIIRLQREAGDVIGLVMSYYAQGVTVLLLGDYAGAGQMLREALASANQRGDLIVAILTLNALGDLARCEGRFAEAVNHYTESLAICESLGAARERATAARGLARARLRLGDAASAYALFRQHLGDAQADGDHYSLIQALAGLSAWAAAVGLPDACARLLGAVARHRDDQDFILDSAHEADRRDYEHYSDLCRGQLGDAGFEAACAAGGALSLDQAAALALRLASPAVIDALTSREREIVALIGRGLSNGDIAEALVLSKRTVEKHVANIFAKLGLTSRAQVVRWAIEHQLV